MRSYHCLALGLGLLLTSACAPPPAGPPQEAAPATTLVATIQPSSTPQPPELSATPTVAPTETPSATPTAAPGMVPIAPETIGQLRVLWTQDHAVEGSDSGCYLMDCLAMSHVLASAFSPHADRLALGYCEAPRNNRSNPRHYEYYCERRPQVIMLDSLTGDELFRLDTAEVPLSVAFHPERPILAAGLANREIELWDLETQTRFRTLSHSSKSTGVVGLAFSPDGELLVSEGDDTLQIWDWENPPFLQDTIRSTTGIAFSPDGRWLSTEHLPAGSDGAFRIRLYDLPYTGHFVELPTQTGWRLAFSPTRPLLIARNSTNIQLWDPESGERLREYDTDTLSPQASLDLTSSFTPEGLLLWSLTESDFVPEEDPAAEASFACGPLLWDPLAGQGWYARAVEDGCYEWEAIVYEAGPSRLQLSADGRLLLSRSDGLLQVVGVDPQSPASEPVCVGECPEP